jgi:hypothetical protein
VSAGLMARKASDKPSEPKRMIFAMRGSEAFRVWMEELAEHCGMSVSMLVDRSLRRTAKAEGFTKPAPKR